LTDNTPTNATPSPQRPAPAKKKEKRPGVFQRIGKYLKDTRSEIKKVVWPSKSQIVNNTAVVIACIVVVGAFIGGLDFVFTRGLALLLSLL